MCGKGSRLIRGWQLIGTALLAISSRGFGDPCGNFLHLLGAPGRNAFFARLDVPATLKIVEALAQRPGVVVEKIGESQGLPLYRVRISASPGSMNRPPIRVLVTAGAHGNEPVGVASLLGVIEQVLADDSLREGVEWTFYPALNLTGLRDGTRFLPDGSDFNRVILPTSKNPVARSFMNSLGDTPFTLGLDLHSARARSGFFLIRAGADGGIAQRGLGVLAPNLVLSRLPEGSEPSGRRKDRWIGPGEVESDTAGTIKGFLVARGTPYAYTVESPGQRDTGEVYRETERLVVEMVRQVLQKERGTGRYLP